LKEKEKEEITIIRKLCGVREEKTLKEHNLTELYRKKDFERLRTLAKKNSIHKWYTKT
jgi:hypothetical protein